MRLQEVHHKAGAPVNKSLNIASAAFDPNLSSLERRERNDSTSGTRMVVQILMWAGLDLMQEGNRSEAEPWASSSNAENGEPGGKREGGSRPQACKRALCIEASGPVLLIPVSSKPCLAIRGEEL